MADKAHRLTDEKLEEMEKRLSAIYSRADKEITKKYNDLLQKIAIEDRKKRELVKVGKLSEDEYNAEMVVINKRISVQTSIAEAHRPFTSEEVTAMLITAQINTLTVDDNTALRMKQFYPTFDSIVGQKVKQGFKFTYADKLWSVAQPEMVIQSHYPPGTGMESMYTEVCETHAGTLDDPIPYSGNMALENGKHYMQNFEIYLCNRDTVNPVYSALSELVGLYVDAV